MVVAAVAAARWPPLCLCTGSYSAYMHECGGWIGFTSAPPELYQRPQGGQKLAGRQEAVWLICQLAEDGAAIPDVWGKHLLGGQQEVSIHVVFAITSFRQGMVISSWPHCLVRYIVKELSTMSGGNPLLASIRSCPRHFAAVRPARQPLCVKLWLAPSSRPASFLAWLHPTIRHGLALSVTC